MRLVTIVYVTHMDRSLGWYRRLLPSAGLVSSSPYWSELSIGDGASLALHGADDVAAGTQLGVALTADRPLEEVRNSLVAKEVEIARDIAPEPFGRSLVIRDPDGLAIQINEHDPERYPAEA